MKNFNNKIAVMIFGKPGSGKGTQADFFVDKFGLHHFDTGKEIERTVHDPAFAEDAVIQRERDMFDRGLFNSDDWVINLIGQSIKKISSGDNGIIFSGSPRRPHEGLRVVASLKEAYGKENIYAFVLAVGDDTAIYRNTRRRICKNCLRSVIWKPETALLKECQKCSGPLFKRPLDTEEIMLRRLRGYAAETLPTINLVKNSGVNFFEIDGERQPEDIFRELMSFI